MNVISGVCRLDSGPVDRGIVKRMNGAADLLFAHRRRSWFGGPVGFSWAEPDVPEPEFRQFPRGQAGGCTLAFDGRLDNRKSLVADLRERGVGSHSDDVELTLAAYEEWGVDCPRRLIGDFAFGLWDVDRRRLLCVRDPLGVRPLYTLVHDEVIYFATQLRQILAGLSRTPIFDVEFVADRLALGTDRADARCTPYRGVARLKPGQLLVVENGRVRTERYWKWRAASGNAKAAAEAYVEQFRETFAEAIRTRMRGPGRVWSDLSGGLDSSSIVSLAARRSAGGPLPTVSVVFGRSRLSDEREWAAAVARASDVEQHFIDGDVHHPLGGLREAVPYWDEPHAAAAFFGVHRQYHRLMSSNGAPPILLSGIGAEPVVMSKFQTPVHLADLLRRGHLRSLWRELDRWQRVLKMPLSNLVSRFCLRPLMGQAVIGSYLLPQVHDWVTPSFARKWDLRARAVRNNMPSLCDDVADRWQVERIGSITGLLLRGYLERACDIRYPFLHRPLVELVLATPWHVKEVPGETKALLRRAMRGVLPEKVRRRTEDVSTGHSVYAGVRKEWPVLEQVAGSSVLVDLGIVDREKLRNALHLARQGHAFHLGGLLTTLVLDAWLQYAAHKGDTLWLKSAA